MHLEPPRFEIAGFTNHIKVTVEFPSVLPQIVHDEGLRFHLVLIIEEESEDIVKTVGSPNSSELARNTLDALL